MSDITNNLTSFYTNALANKNSYNQAFVQAVKKYDTDNDGKISENELNVYVQEYMQAHSTENLTMDEAKNKILTEIQSYSISTADTVKSGLNKVLSNSTIYNQAVVNGIKAYDTNGDGQLSDEEIANSGVSDDKIVELFSSLGLIANDDGSYNNERSQIITAGIQTAAETAFNAMYQYPGVSDEDVVNYIKTELKNNQDLSNTEIDAIASLGVHKAQFAKQVVDTANNFIANNINDAAAIANAIKEQNSEVSNVLSDEDVLSLVNYAIYNAAQAANAAVETGVTAGTVVNTGTNTAAATEAADTKDTSDTDAVVNKALNIHKDIDEDEIEIKDITLDTAEDKAAGTAAEDVKVNSNGSVQYKYNGEWHNEGEKFTINKTDAATDGNTKYVTTGQFDSNGNLTTSSTPLYRTDEGSEWHEPGESFTITEDGKRWTNSSFNDDGTLNKSGLEYNYNGSWYKPNTTFIISEQVGDDTVSKEAKFDNKGVMITSEEAAPEQKDNIDVDNPQDIISEGNPENVISNENSQDIINDDNPEDVISDENPQDIINDDNPEDVIVDANPQNIIEDNKPEDIIDDENPKV